MSQKITITTKIKKDTNAIDKVEYQWHWNRIVLTFLSILLILICVVWWMLSAVSVNETAVVLNVEAYNEEAKTKLNRASEKTSKLVQKSPLITESIIKQEKSQKTTKSNEIKSESVAPQVVEAEIVKAQKDDTLVNDQIIHSSTLIAQSHLSKVSYDSLIDTDFVTRAVLTTSVENKEPVDVLSSQIFQSSINGQLFFFTEINNMQLQVVSHRWFFEDTLMAEVELNIFSEKYRTYSSKKIMTKQNGNWRVELVNAKKNILASKSFHIK
ncbi:hypothetical protein CJF42_21245 [Pseudoalteromonas sp. NBT06-2]|uniref:DUF2914 domain-containing protein n=1 Tax=Pseudoalteromonas sp. NBT06-2 TaxID=2025950 RepID=UPI000BA5D10F|nr:DUF2914 domain-containing protein [Pseudoalteromonas sp. NBT06-2]PAJ72425.1 hypothetical protein CJF42_21245 [Pseudoalteromonas sp. NBT06-2]